MYKKLNELFPGFFQDTIEKEDSTYGSYLKYLRLSQHLTLRELSELSGLSMSALCSYEANRKKPLPTSLKKLMHVLKGDRDIL